METESTNQHKKAFKAAETAVENGQRVPIVEPKFPDEKTLAEMLDAAREEGRDEATKEIFTILMAGGADALEAGMRAHLLAWLTDTHPALPRNQRELAQAAGVSQSAISKGIKAQCAKSPDFAMALDRTDAA